MDGWMDGWITGWMAEILSKLFNVLSFKPFELCFVLFYGLYVFVSCGSMWLETWNIGLKRIKNNLDE